MITAPVVDSVEARVIALVSQQTGYPADMLDLDLDLEADLGIDTVKQAETFAAIREEFNIPRRDDLNLREYSTLEKVIGFVKESVTDDNAVAVAIALAPGAREFWFHFGDIAIGPPARRHRINTIENLVSGERHTLEWGGVRLRLDPAQDPALIFRCAA